MNNTKIFLTGTARGGTSVVAKMLSANKNVNIASGPLLEILRLRRNLILNKIIESTVFELNFPLGTDILGKPLIPVN